ncbi:hypothetical protein [Fimbriiglobus ruber]|uniref:Uncharacterized protein n=1 Tax=Fimbriiglobus ruber TaxID=1908690 RepID=A0A225EFL7_9BACT|nr:hypothetical protein [Fimbriiglobus ruber]OWK47037.1 hypothetical protein FRUB_00736 [Fimbriiglobus ruber]
MTRMSREFSLVLLGTGILTAGYFAAPSPEDELEKKADEQAAARVGDNSGNPNHHYGHGLIFVHSPGYVGRYGSSPGRSPASPSVSRGGFGGAGHTMTGGG